MSDQVTNPLEKDQFIDADQIAEEVPDDKDHHMSEDDDEELGEAEDDESNVIEIDMSNNSSSYFDTHTDSVFLISSHPTLPMVVSGGGDDLGYLWTTHSNPSRLVAQLTGHTESVIAGGFTPDGQYLVTGDMSGQIRSWKSMSKGQKWDFYASVQEVEEIIWIRFHPKQPYIFALGASDGTVWVYSLEPKLEVIAVLSSHSLPTNSGIFVDVDDMDNLKLITVSDDATIINWNVYTQTAAYTLTPKELYGEHPWVSLALSPSGRTIAAGSSDGKLAIISVEEGNVLTLFDTIGDDSNIELEAQSIEDIAWSDNTNIIAVGNVAGQILLYEVGSWKLRRKIQLDESITKLEFIPKSPILVSSAHDGSLNKWDVRSGEQKWSGKGHNAAVLGFALQENGKRIISAGDEGVCLVFNDEGNSNQLVSVPRS
jgi:ribosome assembly protein SQT1